MAAWGMHLQLPPVRGHDIAIMVAALLLTLTVGLQFGLLLVALDFLGEELDNYV